MQVKFIAHAGFSIEEDDFQLLIDPWFRDSTLEQPLIEGINRKQTIEFQIPPTKENIADYTPHAVLLSHFHTHHSPYRDVTTVIENSLHDVILAHPDCYANTIVENRFGTIPQLTIKKMQDGDTFDIGPFTVRALSHTVQDHLAWSIKSKTGHVLHIADGAANVNFDYNNLHEVWKKFENLSLDIVFMSASRNALRVEKEGRRGIIESGCFSPIQAARLIEKIKPRIVATIGNHNHSFKRNRLEFIPELPATEEEFRWALDWLAEKTPYVAIRPGHVFLIGEPVTPNTAFNTYIPPLDRR